MTEHWLRRPQTIRWLWIIFIVILAATVVAELFIHRHTEFGVDALFGFHAWYGLGTCAIMIVFAKVLGFVLKRKDTYYDGE